MSPPSALSAGVGSVDAFVSDASVAAVSAGGSPLVVSGSASSIVFRLPANCAISFLDTSPMMPRPNWATLPVMCRSVVTTTRVDVGDRLSACAAISAEALPRPPVSRPSALRVAVWAASSRSMNEA